MDKTTAQSAIAYTQPETAVVNTEKASHHETNTQGDHFVVALSVTVASGGSRNLRTGGRGPGLKIVLMPLHA